MTSLHVPDEWKLLGKYFVHLFIIKEGCKKIKAHARNMKSQCILKGQLRNSRWFLPKSGLFGRWSYITGIRQGRVRPPTIEGIPAGSVSLEKETAESYIKTLLPWRSSVLCFRRPRITKTAILRARLQDSWGKGLVYFHEDNQNFEAQRGSPSLQ